MKVKRYNITIPKKYTKNGEEKTQWNNVGNIVLFFEDGKEESGIVEIPAIGMEAKVFLQKPRENGERKANNDYNQMGNDEAPTVNVGDDINPDDIPF